MDHSMHSNEPYPSGDEIRAALAERLTGPVAGLEPGPPAVPDHTLLGRIGRGAYGEVWLARNALGTLRAVKVVYRARFKEDRPYEREFNGILKYEPISRLHEGLVQVLHAGRNDQAGYFYYVMELADDAHAPCQTSKADSPNLPAAATVPWSVGGRPSERYRPHTLRSDLLDHQPLPPTEAARLVLRLASALGHLHANGLVHRDIKPSNVIFVGGQPKLADIGLVTDAGSAHSFVGTEGFIPPEGPGTPQADLYGLGKLLYELATGRDRLDFPQLPLDVARLPDGEGLLELNELMTRACAPDPAQRYPSTTEMQAELNLFLAGRSLRRARNTERHLARLKRVVAAASLFLALAGVALWFLWNEERRALQRARVEAALRQRAEAAEQAARQQLHTALLEQSRATVRSGEMGHRVRALEALARAAAISNTLELRREAFAALALPDLRFERELPCGSEFTLRTLDPSFDRIALGRGGGPVEIRSVEEQRLLATLPASTNLPTHYAEWSLDGRFLAVKRDHGAGGVRADWEIWHAADARRVLRLQDVSLSGVSFHPRLQQIMVGRNTGEVVIRELEEGGQLASFRLAGEPVCLKFAPEGDRFAAVCQVDGASVVTVHDVANAAALASHSFADFVGTVQWHPSGRWIAVPDHSGAVHELDSQTGETRVLGRHKAQAVGVTFSPDGVYLISGGWERELICWEIAGQRRVFGIGLDSYTAQFRADGAACAVITRSGVQFHAFERTRGHRDLAEDLGPRLRHAAFSPDGRWLAAAGEKGMGVWDLESSGPGAFREEGRGAHLFFTPDGHELFGSRSAATETNCFRWRLQAATNRAAPPELVPLPLSKPDGFTFLALRSNLVVWTGFQGSQLLAPDELEAGTARWTPTRPGISGISPDGRWLGIFRPFGPSLHLYRLPEIEPVASLQHPANIADFEFSPWGDEVAVCSSRGVQFWSTTTWQSTRFLTNFSRVLYAPDARSLWLTRDLRTSGLYNANTLEPLLPLPTGMFPLASSPDGRRLAVSVDARRVQVWDLEEVRRCLRELGMGWAETP